MKHLNKLIFINSAFIPYQEVCTDGNVLINGSQGKGKTTILIALTYFYTANSQRLGIKSEQLNFVNFYLPYPNSYLVYEVSRGDDAYTIIAHSYQGAVTWTFVDAHYDRNWFMDESLNVMDSIQKVIARIDPSISHSKLVKSPAEYRRILAGTPSDKSFLRYAMLNGANFDSIASGIENVFLNSGLDSGFVKKAIVQAINDSEDVEQTVLDLNGYKSLLSNFEAEYNEINEWFKKENKNEVHIRKIADIISEEGRKIQLYDYELVEIWRKLNYAISESKKALPLQEREIDELSKEFQREAEKFDNINIEYNKKKDSLNQKLGAVEAMLKDIAQKRKKYMSMKIDEIISLDNKEDSISQEKKSYKEQLNILLSVQDSIESKYKTILDALDNDLKGFINAQQAEFFKEKESIETERRRLYDTLKKRRNEMLAQQAEWRKEIDLMVENLTKEQTEAEHSLEEIKSWHPLSKEISEIESSIKELEDGIKNYKLKIQFADNEIERIQNECIHIEAQYKDKLNQNIEKIRNQKQEYAQKLDKINSLLENLNGSLYQWLCENKEGWEENIGKVVDEERILYSRMTPELDEASLSLYGVRIDLDEIKSVHRTPDQLRKESEKLLKAIKELDSQIVLLQTKFEEDIKKTNAEYASNLEPLRRERTLNDLKIKQDTTKINQLTLDLKRQKDEEDKLIASEKNRRQQIYNHAVLNLDDKKKEKSSCEQKHQKDLKELDASSTRIDKELDERISLFKAEQESRLSAKQAENAKQIKSVQEQRNKELAGQGVDTDILDEYRKKLNDVNLLLECIKQNKQTVHQYMSVKEDLFDQEPTKKAEAESIRITLNQLQKQFEEKKNRIENKQKEREAKLADIKEQIKTTIENLELYEQSMESECLFPQTYIDDSTKIATKQSCKELISEGRGINRQKYNTMDSLKSYVRKFNSRLRPNNVFNFNTMPVSDADYLLIAEDLQSFLDNKKIDTFAYKVSEHFLELFHWISFAITPMLQKKADVKRIIDEINKDFKGDNFTDVIKSFEIKMEDTTDPMAIKLIAIDEFVSENSALIGDANLFSPEDNREINRNVINMLRELALLLNKVQDPVYTLADMFTLRIRIKENMNDTGYREFINNVGSKGTGTLIKTMIMIMLINISRKKAAKKGSDFVVHCILDEVGTIHYENVKGLLRFANSRNIYILNGAPSSDNQYDYKYVYQAEKTNNYTTLTLLTERI